MAFLSARPLIDNAPADLRVVIAYGSDTAYGVRGMDDRRADVLSTGELQSRGMRVWVDQADFADSFVSNRRLTVDDITYVLGPVMRYPGTLRGLNLEQPNAR